LNELTPVGPENDIVFVGIISALEEIEEKVTSFDVNVSCVPTSEYGTKTYGSLNTRGTRSRERNATNLTESSQKPLGVFFILTLCLGNAGCPKVVKPVSDRELKPSRGVNRPASWDDAQFAFG
jgi:hypothetical protein